MRFATAILSAIAVILHSTLVVADSLTILECTTWWGSKDRTTAIWHTDHGSHSVDASNDCRDPDVPIVWEFCMDYSMKRGHFKATGQNKRCFVESNSKQVGGSYAGDALCSILKYSEVFCGW
ncbi:hypothetical protein B0T25DRAFT_550546 [Lasiosphaeria hispida]|uniref:Secreted protein n=1 Tax=Lasiosphaeria hispida TaxID=260671 RepID=A0AAJ0HAQ5_9PEZI|nr:hypothetical protein B0T25DRAFT_550546 [Lasiosphaeria hispida]